MTHVISPEFGAYALPPAREAARLRARQYADTRFGRLMISRARKKAMAGENGPFDVEIDPGVRARLYPRSNRCEKRAFTGPQIWDAVERDALRAAVQNGSDTPFTFLDVGANVGLYSLYVNAYAAAVGRTVRIVAIEPGMEICARLEANIAANDASVQIIRAAISDTPGTGYLGAGPDNLGESKLVDAISGEDSEAVVIDTLARICRTQGLVMIDAMKLDIEGYDKRALTAFFADAPTRLHPQLLILETGRDAASPLIALCEDHDYTIKTRSGLNTIMEKRNG